MQLTGGILPPTFPNGKDTQMRIAVPLTVVAATLVAGRFMLADADDEAKAKRPDCWAQPVKTDGVPNLFRVTDDLYRSAQPTVAGMRRLKDLGVETVVSLRSFHSDRDEIADTGLGYEHIYMKAWHPEEKELVRFLQIITNEKRTPVLVHCQHGADRTGLMCAVYRIAVQGWTKEDAITEMTEGGYGFNPIWTNIVEYIRDLDVEHIRERAGLTGTESGDCDQALQIETAS